MAGIWIRKLALLEFGGSQGELLWAASWGWGAWLFYVAPRTR
jgi:hypothetical protein